jgi:limonene-1,2-epoxide hydrolase
MSIIHRFQTLYQQLSDFSAESMAQVYAEEIVFIDPITQHHGLDKVITYYESLLSGLHSCRFTITNLMACQENSDDIDYVLTWQMEVIRRPHDKAIELTGITQLKVLNDRIIYHRDYYDVGQMVYEHIPLLGGLIRLIKRKLMA